MCFKILETYNKLLISAVFIDYHFVNSKISGIFVASK